MEGDDSCEARTREYLSVVSGRKNLNAFLLVFEEEAIEQARLKQTAWFLRHGLSEESLEPEIERYREGVEHLAINLAAALPKEAQGRFAGEQKRLEGEGVRHRSPCGWQRWSR